MIPFHRRLSWLARQQTDAPAIVDDSGMLTFGQAGNLATRMAAALVRSGLKPGDRFVVLSANRRESMLAYFAASATGTVCTQLNTRLASAELAEIAGDAAPALALADAEGAARLSSAGVDFPIIGFDPGAPGSLAFPQWIADAERTPAPDCDTAFDSPLFQLYTSGTTGRPSGIVISQGAWASQLEQFRLSQPYGPGDGVLIVTPLFHIAAAITGFSALVCGARIALPGRFDAEEVFDALAGGTVAGTMMVPAMIDTLVDTARRRGVERVSGVRRICYGASPITEGLLRNALDLFGCDFIQGYGLTETAGVATVLMPDDHRRALAGEVHLLRSAGRPVAGQQLRIALDSGAVGAAGELGEIQVRGPNLFSGYFNNPDRTALAWTDDGWFRSGDAGTIDDEGFVFVIDRIKDLIITGGENVFPQEVERALARHPAVAQVAVYGIGDPHWGESVAAAIVMREGAAFDEPAMRAFAESQLARFKTPRHYLILSELPRNATGKVLRKALAEQHKGEATAPA